MKQVYSLNDYIKAEFNTPVRIDSYCTIGHRQNYLHWHPHYEVQIIFSGEYVIENSTAKVEDNRPVIFIHAPYSLHTANSDNDLLYRRNIISIRRDVLTPLPRELLDMSVFNGVNLAYAFPTPVQMDEFGQLCLMMKDYINDRSYSALYSAILFRKIFDIIDSGTGEFIRSRVSYMQDVLHFVASNLANPLTLDELAAQYGVGRSKLNLDFRTATGKTYKNYLTDLRMTRARTILSSGSSIINASLETGYSSEAHFIAAFKAYWGITPGASQKRDH